MTKKTVNDVEQFWNNNPLFTGEAIFDENNPTKFFDEHDIAYFDDVFSGINFKRTFFFPNETDSVLDLGCGIGFWTNLFYKKYSVEKITSADLTEEALKICKLRVPMTEIKKENAESLSFDDQSFNHINCQGVIHHTPNTQACVDEIYRVLKRGGTASISVYYRNSLLKFSSIFLPVIKLAAKIFLRDTGRGRDFSKVKDVDDIVRFYDGNQNPIGKAYSKKQFLNMLKNSGFENIEVKYFFFPFRFLKFKIPQFLRKILVYVMPFMIVANITK